MQIYKLLPRVRHCDGLSFRYVFTEDKRDFCLWSAGVLNGLVFQK